MFVTRKPAVQAAACCATRLAVLIPVMTRQSCTRADTQARVEIMGQMYPPAVLAGAAYDANGAYMRLDTRILRLPGRQLLSLNAEVQTS